MKTLVVLLHGVNARGRDMAPIARHWDLPGATVIAPEGSEPSGETPGARRWFSIRDITPANRPERVVAARTAFDAMLRHAMAVAGLAGRADRVALVGFSQGAIMALDAVASGRWNLGAVVAISGRFATLDRPPVQTPVLVLHGDRDPAIPVSESEHALACLRGTGCPVSLTILPGMGHFVSAEAAALTGDFLRRTLVQPA